MSRKRLTQLTMVLIIIAVVVIIRPWYILDETEQAVILQLGKPIATIKEAGSTSSYLIPPGGLQI